MMLVTYLRPSQPVFGFAQLSTLEPRTAQIIPLAVERVGKPPRYDAGLRPADLYLYAVEPGTPAAALGLRAGDVLTTLDGEKLLAWELFEQALDERPTDAHTLGWRSADGVEHTATLRLEPRRELDEYQAEATSYVFGGVPARALQPVPETAIEPRLGLAIASAVERALAVTAMLVKVLGLTVVGRLPATAIGGPLLIYSVAGVAAQHGAGQFLAMAALVSLNLGLLNLLPVPLLDGGQASLVVLEAVRRRPVSARARARAAYVGIALLVMMMLLASRNDILRHFFR
jgi:regulator of sigma E protease